MTRVVSDITYYEGLTSTYAIKHTTIKVADASDLSHKADKTDLWEIRDQLNEQISDVEKKCKTLEKKLTNAINEHKQFVNKDELSKLKDDLLVVVRAEKDSISKFGDVFIENIKKQCELERDAIHNEVVAFKQIDINDKLAKKLIPLETIIYQLIEKTKNIKSQWDDLQRIRQEVSSIYANMRQMQDECTDCFKNCKKMLVEAQEYSQKIQEEKKQLTELFRISTLSKISTIPNKNIKLQEACMCNMKNELKGYNTLHSKLLLLLDRFFAWYIIKWWNPLVPFGIFLCCYLLMGIIGYYSDVDKIYCKFTGGLTILSFIAAVFTSFVHFLLEKRWWDFCLLFLTSVIFACGYLFFVYFF